MNNEALKEPSQTQFLRQFWFRCDFYFISLYIWFGTENMLTIPIAFIIPVLINTVIDDLKLTA